MLALLLASAFAPAQAAKPAAKPVPRVAARNGVPIKTVPANTPGALTLLYGDDHVFGVVVPKGWVADDSSGIGSRIRTVFYPAGQTWAAAKAVMYANPLHQDDKVRRTLRQMIDKDVAAFRKASPRGKVTTVPSITTVNGQTAEVRYFAPGGASPSEAVAYVAEQDLVMLLVLSAREPDAFQRSLPAFRELVTGYQFVGAGLQTPTGR